MVRVFITSAQIVDGVLTLTGGDARHLAGALRLRPGEQLVAVSEDGIEHLCVVTASEPGKLVARVESSAASKREPTHHLRMAVGLLKGDQLERIFEYCTELGASSFQPLLAERSVARPPADRLQSKMHRWREVIRSGAELGQRGRLPELLEAVTLIGSIEHSLGDGLTPYLLYEGTGLRALSDVDISQGGTCLLVGPEGGWSEAEVAGARAAGAEPVTLGPRIMRPPPAALVAAAIVLSRAGDLDLKEA